MFELSHVSRQFSGDFALNDVSMTIGRGMNFVVGPSGSGKTTLLKILSGMDSQFDGDVTYGGQSLKTLTPGQRRYFYGHVFGFVWQDFNLLEDATVLENVLLPGGSRETAEKLLSSLKIRNLADQKAKRLSGGQKQRVAIARELMKDPQVILADEPTSALDGKSARIIMDLLRSLSKSRTVIVVTHDTSLIEKADKVFELDKGELTASPQEPAKSVRQKPQVRNTGLSPLRAGKIAAVQVKNRPGRFAVSVLTLLIGSVLLMTSFGGILTGAGAGEFDKLYETYGDGLLDISIVNSYMSADGTGGADQEGPNADVTQDISGLYDRYVNDSRVDFAAYLQAFNEIQVQLDGKSYQIQSTGSVPVINKLLTGKMPDGDQYEVTVPESFVEMTGLTNESILGKELKFDASIYNWSTGNPVAKTVSVNAKIVGVADTSAFYDYEGTTQSFQVTDAFFFNRAALENLRSQAGVAEYEANFQIRAKTPADMISLKDELNQMGISPLGRFSLVEDMVRLENQTNQQSGTANAVIGSLALALTAAVFLLTGALRRREYAIFKVSGFGNGDLMLINFTETLLNAAASAVLLLILSPALGAAAKALFDVDITGAKAITTGLVLTLALGIVGFLACLPFCLRSNGADLKTGDKA